MNGWAKAYDSLQHQLIVIEKIYKNNGLTLKLTCGACPEQYDVFDSSNKQVAYLRLRHGEFRVYVPDCGGETIYYAEPNGDGIFDENERLVFMTKAMREILKKL